MALALVFSGCDPSVGVITYPCKHPEATHMGPDGKPDPCHFDDPSSPAAAVSTFFEAAAPPFCEAFFSCCTNTELVQALAGASVDDCKARWSSGEGLGDLTLTSLKAALVNGETVFDQTKLDSCVTQLKAIAAGGTACAEPPAYVFFNTCMSAFQGQIEPGEACTWGESKVEDLSFTECKDGRCFEGKCTAFRKTGDECLVGAYVADPPDTICNYPRGEWCMGLGTSWTCGSQTEIGSGCISLYGNYQCKSLTCTDNADPGTCLPPSADNTACNVY